MVLMVLGGVVTTVMGWLKEIVLLLMFMVLGGFALNIKFFSSQASQRQCNVSHAVSLLILSGSVGHTVSTMNLIVFILSTQLIKAVNAWDELGAIKNGMGGVVGDNVVSGPVPFTLYLIDITCAWLVRCRL